MVCNQQFLCVSAYLYDADFYSFKSIKLREERNFFCKYYWTLLYLNEKV